MQSRPATALIEQNGTLSVHKRIITVHQGVRWIDPWLRRRKVLMAWQVL